jgi:hypothetical protein
MCIACKKPNETNMARVLKYCSEAHVSVYNRNCAICNYWLQENNNINKIQELQLQLLTGELIFCLLNI